MIIFLLLKEGGVTSVLKINSLANAARTDSGGADPLPIRESLQSEVQSCHD